MMLPKGDKKKVTVDPHDNALEKASDFLGFKKEYLYLADAKGNPLSCKNNKLTRFLDYNITADDSSVYVKIMNKISYFGDIKGEVFMRNDGTGRDLLDKVSS
mmetsp:Transcript_10183/g.8728  ORF Transcript_10183/g.8728 Transcript_10183/m.8728 type:complete len:102 (+) Transcript_10183:322-627(+)|eukprot:CAMPEP_0114591188 /NCGR_PEP_ID=MMETSP0125-20121206/13300_1 /TAXON_ID=485358 ORGANISM="Aristerostoma sp., Strain ATCC 50986" /NCGR_SAMPLE_ID=MMETSP0125 /ASSEMBLY_ACC=CAM_ASM_000245 /LENGTH=101 /DNA_ID=CAMNT_0001789153 /DNA_START=287 /DNA_END=592 /DNA_ORIENTATION=-